MRMTPDSDQPVRCSASTCSSFKPGSAQLRSCDRCGHSWVAHALEKLHLQARPPSSCGPVEVALPGLVSDLSSLVLYGAQAVPVRLKILLDRLYSVLTPEQVGHILHTLGWSLGDYVRGYMLQLPNGKVLDRWLMVTPEEELLILKQFLRFGETRPIVQLMTLQHQEALSTSSMKEPPPSPRSCPTNFSFTEPNAGTPGELKHKRGYPSPGADVCPISKNRPHNNVVHHFENIPGRMSLLLPFHFPNSSLYLPTKELDPPSKVKLVWKSSLPKQDGREREPPKGELTIKIKADPDKPSLSQRSWFKDEKESDLHRRLSKQETTSPLPPSIHPSFISPSFPVSTSNCSSPQKIPQRLHDSLSPLPSFSSSFLCPLPTSSFSSALRPLPSTPSSLQPLPSSLCSLPPPAGGRKGRVCCGVCGKSFYDKGTLKIHYNAVHLKIKHRCTVAGCTMVFSSLRSRNRHSANPNPRLHTGTSRTSDQHPGSHRDSPMLQRARKNLHKDQARIWRTKDSLWRHGGGDDMDALRNGLTYQVNLQPGCQVDSPPPSPPPLSQTFSQDAKQNFCQPPPHTKTPSSLFPAHSPSSLGSHPSSIDPPRDSLSLNLDLESPSSFPDPTSISSPSFMSQLVPHGDGALEETPNQAHISPTKKQRWCGPGDPVPKKKPRKSSMPVKIERQKTEGRRDKDQEDF